MWPLHLTFVLPFLLIALMGCSAQDAGLSGPDDVSINNLPCPFYGNTPPTPNPSGSSNPYGYEFSSEWEAGYLKLEEYLKAQGDVLVPYEYQTSNGCKLGEWVAKQRYKGSREGQQYTSEYGVDFDHKEGIMRRGKLDDLGFVWDVPGQTDLFTPSYMSEEVK